MCSPDDFLDIKLTHHGCYQNAKDPHPRRKYSYRRAVAPFRGKPQITIGIPIQQLDSIFLDILHYPYENKYKPYIEATTVYYNFIIQLFSGLVGPFDKNNISLLKLVIYMGHCHYKFVTSKKDNVYYKSFLPLKPRTDIRPFLGLLKGLNKVYEIIRSNTHMITSKPEVYANIHVEELLHILHYVCVDELTVPGDVLEYITDTLDTMIIEFRDLPEWYRIVMHIDEIPVDMDNQYAVSIKDLKERKRYILSFFQSYVQLMKNMLPVLLEKYPNMTWGTEFETNIVYDENLLVDLKNAMGFAYDDILSKLVSFRDGDALRFYKEEPMRVDITKEYLFSIQKKHLGPYLNCDGVTDDVECAKRIPYMEIITGEFNRDQLDLFFYWCNIIDNITDSLLTISSLVYLWNNGRKSRKSRKSRKVTRIRRSKRKTNRK